MKFFCFVMYKDGNYRGTTYEKFDIVEYINIQEETGGCTIEFILGGTRDLSDKIGHRVYSGIIRSFDRFDMHEFNEFLKSEKPEIFSIEIEQE